MAKDSILPIGSRLFMDIGFSESRPAISKATRGKSLRGLRSYVSDFFSVKKSSILRYLRLVKYLRGTKSEFPGLEIYNEVTLLGSTTIESLSLDMIALAGPTSP